MVIFFGCSLEGVSVVLQMLDLLCKLKNDVKGLKVRTVLLSTCMYDDMTLCPIQSVIILVINKFHSYDYRTNWTPLSNVIIINCRVILFGQHLH